MKEREPSDEERRSEAIAESGTIEPPARQAYEEDASETARQKRRKIARIFLLLFFGIPAVYSLAMGIVQIIRYIISDFG